jgi:hypothetical protein
VPKTTTDRLRAQTREIESVGHRLAWRQVETQATAEAADALSARDARATQGCGPRLGEPTGSPDGDNREMNSKIEQSGKGLHRHRAWCATARNMVRLAHHTREATALVEYHREASARRTEFREASDRRSWRRRCAGCNRSRLPGGAILPGPGDTAESHEQAQRMPYYPDWDMLGARFDLDAGPFRT